MGLVVVYMWHKNAYMVMVRKHKGKRPLVNLRNMEITMDLLKCYIKLWTGCNWLRIESSGEFL
jgi:hypothetical protein